MNWLMLTAEKQLNDINVQSFDANVKAIVLFKHSTRCSISTMALNRIERSWNLPEVEVPTYYLDLLNNRSLSEKIAQTYSISHESPQVLIIKNGKCIYNASHSNISTLDIQEAINS
jgi:bacillithiol system protein YtxJ